tara:strand:+ start:722 stop:886 length:165 start_codon:yes stop_codon:yes gene_type:complete
MTEFDLQNALDMKYGTWSYQVSVTDTSVDVWDGLHGHWLESFDSAIEFVYAYDL